MKNIKKITFSLLAFCLVGGFAFAQTESGSTNEYDEMQNQQTESQEAGEGAGQSSEDAVQLGGGGIKESLVRDGAYDKIGVKEKIALPYDHVREADVFWSKRVWRVVDVRQKMNKPFVFEEQPFIEVLFDIINNNPDVRLFTDDTFTEETSTGSIANKLGSQDTVPVWDDEIEDYRYEVVNNEFNTKTISKFRFKEDWLFDEETSTMLCRILGIAPIRDVMDDNGNFRGQEAMFWIYYPDMRKYLCRYETFNPFNDAIRLTWEDMMEMRLFDSIVMKESNVFNQRIEDVYDGRSRLLESERIETEIFNKEHDLWSY